MLLPGPHPTAGYLILWMVFTYVGYSMLTLGQTAWSATLAPTYQERSRLFGWTQGLAVIGSVALLVLPAVTHGAVVPGRAKDMPTMALYAMIGFPLAVLIAAVFTRERPAVAPAAKQKFSLNDYLFAAKRMWRVVLADLVLTLGPGTTGPIYVYFFHDAKGFVDADVGFLLIFYIGAGIVGAPIWGRVASGASASTARCRSPASVTGSRRRSRWRCRRCTLLATTCCPTACPPRSACSASASAPARSSC